MAISKKIDWQEPKIIELTISLETTNGGSSISDGKGGSMSMPSMILPEGLPF